MFEARGRGLPVRGVLANPADIQNLVDNTQHLRAYLHSGQRRSLQSVCLFSRFGWDAPRTLGKDSGNQSDSSLFVHTGGRPEHEETGGPIVNVTSFTGLEPGGSSIAYLVSKAG